MNTWKYNTGDLVWAYTGEDGYEQFEITEDRKVINGNYCYLVDGRYINQNSLRQSKS